VSPRFLACAQVESVSGSRCCLVVCLLYIIVHVCLFVCLVDVVLLFVITLSLSCCMFRLSMHAPFD
jgi:hypothetical protein